MYVSFSFFFVNIYWLSTESLSGHCHLIIVSLNNWGPQNWSLIFLWNSYQSHSIGVAWPCFPTSNYDKRISCRQEASVTSYRNALVNPLVHILWPGRQMRLCIGKEETFVMLWKSSNTNFFHSWEKQLWALTYLNVTLSFTDWMPDIYLWFGSGGFYSEPIQCRSNSTKTLKIVAPGLSKDHCTP